MLKVNVKSATITISLSCLNDSFMEHQVINGFINWYTYYIVSFIVVNLVCIPKFRSYNWNVQHCGLNCVSHTTFLEAKRDVPQRFRSKCQNVPGKPPRNSWNTILNNALRNYQFSTVFPRFFNRYHIDCFSYICDVIV